MKKHSSLVIKHGNSNSFVVIAEMEKKESNFLKAVKIIDEHFDGDDEKVLMWFATLHPLLGNVSAFHYISYGYISKDIIMKRSKKLLSMIRNLKEGNLP